MNFRVGQRVVCVNGKFAGQMNPGEVAPTLNQALTIRDIWPGVSGDLSPAYFSFEEIRNPKLYHTRSTEAIFGSKHFRPAVERKTDISIFTAMLTPSPERVS